MKKSQLLFLIFAFTLMAFAQGDIPAFHKTAPAKGAKLPPILTQDQMFGASFQYAYQRKAYKAAAKIGNVLYQLPCYCYCDRIGHGSLRTCYESTHAANCSHCMKEAYYAYFQTKQGKTPKQIRDGIVKGEWRTIDLEQAADQVQD